MNTKDDDAKAEAKPARGGLIDEKLFNSRAITIFGEINDKLARSVTEGLLALVAENDEPISIYISSPGGHVESGDVVYDIIKFIKPVVRVIGTGWVHQNSIKKWKPVKVFLMVRKTCIYMLMMQKGLWNPFFLLRRLELQDQ